MKFDKELLLEAEMSIIPPAIFPHKAHTAWLDCDNCHPDLFNIKKKGNAFFHERDPERKLLRSLSPDRCLSDG